MNKHTTHKSIPIADIKINDRLREDYEDNGALMESIKRYGLLHPPTVDDESNLIAGERRVRACRALGWKDIPVKVYSELTDAERLAIEVEENTKRKDLTGAELAKRLDRAERAEEVMPAAGKTTEKGGRPTQGRASKAKIAAKAGLSRQGLERAEKHAKAIAQFPELAKLSQRAALKEFDKRTKPPRDKPAQPKDEPPVASVSEFQFFGEDYGLMDRLIEKAGYKTRTEACRVALKYLWDGLNAVEEIKAVQPMMAYSGPRPCDICKQLVLVKDRVKLKGRSGHRECVRKAA